MSFNLITCSRRCRCLPADPALPSITIEIAGPHPVKVYRPALQGLETLTWKWRRAAKTGGFAGRSASDRRQSAAGNGATFTGRVARLCATPTDAVDKLGITVDICA
jgi:hypothetical protein